MMGKLKYGLFCLLIFSMACQKDDGKLDEVHANSFVKFYGNSYTDYGVKVAQQEDGGYVILGVSANLVRQDIMLIKTDKYGNEQWTRYYGDSLNNVAYDMIPLTSNEFIILGTAIDTLSTEQIYLLKINAVGNIDWEKKIGNNYADETGYSITEAVDGGYVIAGSTNDTNASNLNYGGNKDILIIKTSETGDSLWSRVYGGADSEESKHVIKNNSGGYFFTCSTGSFGGTGQAKSNIVIFTTNTNGIVTDQVIIGGVEDDYGVMMHMNQYSESFLTANTMSFGNGGSDILFTKFGQTLHDTLFFKTYKSGNNETINGFAALDNDNGFAFIGTKNTKEKNNDMYMIKVDPYGNIIFENTFGGVSDETGQSIQQTTDNGFIIMGTTGTTDNSVITLIKTTPGGTLSE